MASLAWYWHRLSAMDRTEIAQRVKRKVLSQVDARRNRDWTSVSLHAGRHYPNLPHPTGAPPSLRAALRQESEDILAGRWRAFGRVPIRVSDPPEWHKDYLADVVLATSRSAFDLDHRSLPKGADIKLIWELSRWHQLTRLAMAAFILEDAKAAWKCVHWLEHWVQHNAPYRGWNWTSALEAGLRLIQFTWIDALLQPFAARGECEAELEQLLYEILPPHAWFTWRHKSFGSSANNHLLGELVGLILAIVRWPELEAWSASLDELQSLWEEEVLAQFAEDGGNREQALHYHLFSFELCWHARTALQTAERRVAPAVEDRLARAAEFFSAVHGTRESWDYGDSDNAFVLPVFASDRDIPREWVAWMLGQHNATAYWIGARAASPAPIPQKVPSAPSPWRVFETSGIAMSDHGTMTLRWDVSPLGYLATAAHGHLDALHLSIWLDETAMVIDPGTGGYFGLPDLRNWLASRPAHNGPHFEGDDWPRRQGPFLWSELHDKPSLGKDDTGLLWADFVTPSGSVRRKVRLGLDGTVLVEDSTSETGRNFAVLWQFAPDARCEIMAPRQIRVTRQGKELEICVSDDWDVVDLVATPPTLTCRSLEGTVSSNFRVTTWAPYLKLVAKVAHNPCVFTTTFLGSRTP